jgi:REP element-mobilizing transposase RayT
MARRPRSILPSYGVFQITTRGVDGCAVYRDRDDRLSFLAQVSQATQRNAWSVYALCLMTNHYHLVVEAHRDLISRGVHRVNGVHAETFNARHRRRGHLWGDRFALWQIRDEEHLRATCLYVYLNPVRAGLCEHAADWDWTWSRFPLDPA